MHYHPIEPIKPHRVVSEDKTGKTRPQGSPKTDKDFNKILDHDPDQQQQPSEETAAVDENTPQTPASIFALSAKQVKSSTPAPMSNPFISKESEQPPTSLTSQNMPNLNQAAVNIPTQDPIAEAKLLADQAKLGTKDPAAEAKNKLGLLGSDEILKQIQLKQAFAKEEQEQASSLSGQENPDVMSLETDATVPSSKTQKTKGQAQGRLDVQENPDLSYVNPGFSPINFNPDEVASQEAVSSSRTIRDLVDQIVKEMRVVQAGERTTTIVTLQHPPLLNGAEIALSTLDSAKRSLDIAFVNLSVAAKQFLDDLVHRDSLTRALEQRGFVVNTLITSTLPEIPSLGPEAQRFARDQEGGRQQQQQQQQEQQEQNEEETA